MVQACRPRRNVASACLQAWRFAGNEDYVGAGIGEPHLPAQAATPASDEETLYGFCDTRLDVQVEVRPGICRLDS